MGDENVNDWEEEALGHDDDDQLVDVIQEREDDGDDDDDSDGNDDNDGPSAKGAKNSSNISATLKKEKKKRKFSEMKEMKRIKLMEQSEEVEEVIENKNILFFKSLKENSPLSTLFHLNDFLDVSKLINPNITCPYRNAVFTALPGFKKMIKNTRSDVYGCPLVVIVSISAIRCTEIVAMISKQIRCKIGKLFAKHIKLQEHIELLNKNLYPIVIGTPNRLNKLLEYGALSLSKSKLLIIETYTDKKQFSVMTLPGICDDFNELMEKSVSAHPDIKLCCV